MNERETERRLRDWLDAQAPPAVPNDLRRAVAAVPATVTVGWPDRLAAALGPRRAAVPRLAWVLLLAGLLLAGLVGGALLVGSQQRRLPAVVSPVGQVFECPPGSNSDKPGPVDQAWPAEERSAMAMAFDRRAGRLVVVASVQYPTGPVETWTFDVCTNTWVRMHPNGEPPRFEWAELVYDVDSDATIGIFSWSVWAYDLQADAWTKKGFVPGTDAAHFVAYDPVSGLVVAAGEGGGLLNYDVDADTWTRIRQANAGPPSRLCDRLRLCAYDASVDRLVAYGDQTGGAPPYETWLFDIRTGTWAESRAERPPVVGWLTAPQIVYDEAAERTVVFMRDPLTAYDASTDRWEILPEAQTVGPNLMVYDPVNRRLVGWGSGGMGSPEGAVEALDLATGEWTVLLEATPGQPTPAPPAP